MNRSIAASLFFASLLFTGCQSVGRVHVDAHEGRNIQAASGSLVAQAIHLEARASVKRNEAARAKRKARRLGMGTPTTKLTGAKRAQISREKRKARMALTRARSLERRARRLRQQIR